MRAWGAAPWGRFPWGRAELAPDAALRPTIVYRAPVLGQLDVAESAPLEVHIGHPAHLLDEESVTLYLDARKVYDGVNGFAVGVIGRVQSASGVVSVQFYAPEGLSYGSRPVLRAVAQDSVGERLDESWTFQVRDNPALYAGFLALPVELSLQKPYTAFLALEQVRQLMFAHVLKPGLVHVSNYGNKASRVIYQLAFATELSTLQNPFRLKDKAALGVTVGEKENTLTLDQTLQLHRDLIEGGIDNFRKLGVFGDDYTKSFREYLDSNLYLYRTSLVSNLILYAAAYEQR